MSQIPKRKTVLQWRSETVCELDQAKETNIRIEAEYAQASLTDSDAGGLETVACFEIDAVGSSTSESASLS